MNVFIALKGTHFVIFISISSIIINTPLPSIKRLSHLNTNARMHFLVVLESFINFNVCVGVFASPAQNLMTVPASTSPVNVMFERR